MNQSDKNTGAVRSYSGLFDALYVIINLNQYVQEEDDEQYDPAYDETGQKLCD